MSYSHFTATERGQIQALRSRGVKMNEIAQTLGRHRCSIWRKLRRNGRGTEYDAVHAQQQYQQRRKVCRPARRLEYQPLWDYVFDTIPGGLTPEQIAGRLPLDYPDEPRMRISHEALYQTLYADERLHCLIKYLPQARPKRRKRGQGKTRRGPSIPNRTGIEHRPPEVQERSRYGDWEDDTLVGANQQAFVATLAERRSLFTILRKTDSKHAAEVAKAITQGFLDMPASWLKTLTLDNGIRPA